MAVYEHKYRNYIGRLTPEWSRFLIIPRHAFRDVFKSKLFTAFFVICFLPLLVEAVLIYLHHNVNALAILKVNVRELLPIDAYFFQTFVNLQGGFAFFGFEIVLGEVAAIGCASVAFGQRAQTAKPTRDS